MTIQYKLDLKKNDLIDLTRSWIGSVIAAKRETHNAPIHSYFCIAFAIIVLQLGYGAGQNTKFLSCNPS